MMNMIRRFVCIAFAAALLVAPLSSVSANPTAQIEQLRAMLDQQDELDTAGAATTDRQLARKWLQEAEILVANGKEDAAKRRLRRAEFAVELVTAMVASAVIRQKAEEQEAYAHTAPEQTEEMRADVERLRERKAELQRELQTLRQYTQ